MIDSSFIGNWIKSLCSHSCALCWSSGTRQCASVGLGALWGGFLRVAGLLIEGVSLLGALRQGRGWWVFSFHGGELYRRGRLRQWQDWIFNATPLTLFNTMKNKTLRFEENWREIGRQLVFLSSGFIFALGYLVIFIGIFRNWPW